MEHRERFIAEGYVREAVPDAKLGSAFEVFFILNRHDVRTAWIRTIGTDRGCPRIWRGKDCFVCAGIICCVLASLTSYVGARTRMNLAIMFGSRVRNCWRSNRQDRNRRDLARLGCRHPECVRNHVWRCDLAHV